MTALCVVSVSYRAFGVGACAATERTHPLAKIIRPYLDQFGETLDFRKTNGQQRELSGIKSYIVFVQGAAKLSAGFYAIHDALQGLKDIRRTKAQRFELVERVIALPAGTVYALEGEVVFQLTEKGWQYDSWNRKRFGYCSTAKSARECYQELKWES